MYNVQVVLAFLFSQETPPELKHGFWFASFVRDNTWVQWYGITIKGIVECRNTLGYTWSCGLNQPDWTRRDTRHTSTIARGRGRGEVKQLVLCVDVYYVCKCVHTRVYKTCYLCLRHHETGLYRVFRMLHMNTLDILRVHNILISISCVYVV